MSIRTVWVMLAVVVSICTCQSKMDINDSKKIEKNKTPISETSNVTPESFLLRDTNIEIFLRDCVCEYDSDDFQIYSKYIINPNWEYSPGYVIFLQTSSDTRQILHGNHHNDWLIDPEHETIYIPGTNPDGTFESIYAYGVHRSQNGSEINGWKVLSASLLDEWLSDAHHLSDTMYENFSDIHVNSLSLNHDQNHVTLKGEASGINMSSGQKYYIDWEYNLEYNTHTSEEKITPCILKVYDPVFNRDDLEACNNAFDAIEHGDWSNVVFFDHMEYIINAENPNWCRTDVNGDGLPELISQYGEHWSGGAGLPIEYIFAYSDGKVKLVFSDLNDDTEYYFLGDNGNLIYDYSDHGIIAYGNYPQCQFDEKWNIEILDRLEIYYFYDDDTYDDEETAHLKEAYPNTYGMGGAGVYCFRSRPKTEEELHFSKDNEYWVRESISKEEFLEAYHQMTGFVFLKENSDWQYFFSY